MNIASLYFRFRWVHAPATLLVLLLQRTPVLRVASQIPQFFRADVADIVKSAFALAALGAYNSVAGATVFNATATSPTTVTPASRAPNGSFTANGAINTAFSLSFTVTGAPGAATTWRISPTTLPSGLTFTLNGLGTRATIAGTPTVSGTFGTFTVTASDGSHSDSVSLTIAIAGATTVAPSFTTQPSPTTQAVNQGSTVTYTALATGTPTPTYQWFFGTTAITGATGTTLTLTNVQPANAGGYSVRATNSVSTAISNTVTLQVNTAPAFTTHPQGATVVAGDSLSLVAAVSGTPTPTLQWYRGATALVGRTNSTLTLTNIQASDAGSYTCVATNSVSSTTSNAAVVVVNSAPSFTTQPTSQTAVAGGTVTFTAAATGSPDPTLQWFRGTTLLTGKTAPTLTINGVQSSDAGDYTVVATNSVSAVTSNVATLTVNVTPVFTSAASAVAVSGVPFAFSAAASGTPEPTFSASGLPAWASFNSTSGAITGTPALTDVGTSSVTFSAINAAATVTQSFALQVKTRFQLWREANFTSGELADTAVSGPDAAVGPDGVKNLVRFALGYAPREAIPATQFVVTRVGAEWVFTYSRPATNPGVTYAVETSTDLSANNWSAQTVTHELVSSAGATETWRGRVTAGGDRQFFRLAVTAQ